MDEFRYKDGLELGEGHELRFVAATFISRNLVYEYVTTKLNELKISRTHCSLTKRGRIALGKFKRVETQRKCCALHSMLCIQSVCIQSVCIQSGYSLEGFTVQKTYSLMLNLLKMLLNAMFESILKLLLHL